MDNIDEKFYDIINGEDWGEDSVISVSPSIYGSLMVPTPMPGIWLNIMFVDGPELFNTGDTDKTW